MTPELWRIYRHYLSEIDDDALTDVFEMLQREVAARKERDRSATRLFLTSLYETDLATAVEMLEAEMDARIEDAQRASCDTYRKQAGGSS